MDTNQKWVNLTFFAGAALVGIIVFMLASRFAAAMDFEGRVQNLPTYIRIAAILVGAITFLVLYKNKVANSFMDEVFVELGKVTWPSQDETLKGTIAVLIAVTIMGFMFGFVDWLWSMIVGFIM